MWRISCNLALLVEPFSWTAFFISLALSAASYAVQRFLGPKPPKAVRGQMQGDLFIQNADEGSPIVEIYGGAPGTAVNKVTWTGLTNTRVNADNSLEKISGADNCFTNASGSGDGGARSVETVTSGDWELSFSFDSVTEGRGFGGMTTNGSFTTDYTQLNYCIHVSDQNNTSGTPHPPHSIFIYESGSGRSISASLQDGTYTAGDTLRIQCVSGVVKYYHKQNLLFTSGVTPSYPMRVGASLACLNKTIDGVTLTTASVDTKGGIKTAGTVVWCKPPRKVVTKEKKGGKGMPKQTVETITYYTDLAILFGRGRLRLKKLWTNADLVLDLDAGIGSAMLTGETTKREAVVRRFQDDLKKHAEKDMRATTLQLEGWRLRWLPPGSFLMGSPAAEPGRDADWRELTNLSKYGVKKITRLGAGKDGKVAVVVE